ncbi:MAG: hypothetical protein ACLTKE_09850 [Coprococcus sp.]
MKKNIRICFQADKNSVRSISENSDSAILMMILLDEPFSAVDNCLKWKLEQQILELSKSYEQHYILFVSHNRDEVYRLCKKLAVMHHGKVEVTGEKEKFFRNPQDGLCQQS